GSSSELAAPKVAPEIPVWIKFWRWMDRNCRKKPRGIRATSMATRAPMMEVLAVMPSCVLQADDGADHAQDDVEDQGSGFQDGGVAPLALLPILPCRDVLHRCHLVSS